MLVELRRARIVRYAVVPWLVVVVSGCQKWVDIDIGPQLPERVRVTQGTAGLECSREAPRFEVYAPSLVGDTLMGRTTSYEAGSRVERTAPMLALPQVCKLEAREADTGATVVVALLAAGAVLGILALAMAGNDIGF